MSKPCYFILFFFIFTTVNTSFSKDISEFDPIMSAETVGTFVRAARCLSIKVSSAEKDSFISQKKIPLPKDIFEPGYLEEVELASVRDFNNIRKALKKHCKETSENIEILLSKRNNDLTFWYKTVLEDFIVSLIAEQTLDKEVRHRLFLFDYTPIGLNDSPY